MYLCTKRWKKKYFFLYMGNLSAEKCRTFSRKSTNRNKFQDFQADNWTTHLASKLKHNTACPLKPAVTESFYYSELGMKLLTLIDYYYFLMGKYYYIFMGKK